jgi:hypothetical protein
LFWALVEPKELHQICKKAIGQGAAFYLLTGCHVAHHGKDIIVNVKSKERLNWSERRNQNKCKEEGKEGYFVEVFLIVSFIF